MSRERKRRRDARRREREGKLPSYGPDVLRLLDEAQAAGGLLAGQLYVVPVYHDETCGMAVGGPCDCNATVGPPRRVPQPEDN